MAWFEGRAVFDGVATDGYVVARLVPAFEARPAAFRWLACLKGGHVVC